MGSQLGINIMKLRIVPLLYHEVSITTCFLSHIRDWALLAFKELRRSSSHCKQQIVEDWMPIGNIYEYICVVHISWHVIFVVGMCNNGIKINFKKEEKNLD
jgi:hypothetical protein